MPSSLLLSCALDAAVAFHGTVDCLPLRMRIDELKTPYAGTSNQSRAAPAHDQWRHLTHPFRWRSVWAGA